MMALFVSVFAEKGVISFFLLYKKNMFAYNTEIKDYAFGG